MSTALASPADNLRHGGWRWWKIDAGSCLYSLSPAFLLAVLLNYCSSLPIAASGSTSKADNECLYYTALIMGLLLWGTHHQYSLYVPNTGLGFRDKNGEPGKYWPSFQSLNSSLGYYSYYTKGVTYSVFNFQSGWGFLMIYCCVLSCFSCLWLFVTLWSAARQVPLSMGFSKQEYWSGLSYPPQESFLTNILLQHLKFFQRFSCYLITVTTDIDAKKTKRGFKASLRLSRDFRQLLPKDHTVYKWPILNLRIPIPALV